MHGFFLYCHLPVCWKTWVKLWKSQFVSVCISLFRYPSPSRIDERLRELSVLSTMKGKFGTPNITRTEQCLYYIYTWMEYEYNIWDVCAL